MKRIDVVTRLQPQFYERLGRRLVLAGSQPCSRFNERCHLKGLRLLFMFIYLYPTPNIYIYSTHTPTYIHTHKRKCPSSLKNLIATGNIFPAPDNTNLTSSPL